MPNPKHPVYIISKGRADSRLTSRALERMGVPYFIVVEEQERDAYAAVIDPKKVLILDRKFQDEYDTCDDLGSTRSKGAGPARNFCWEHAIASGASWHWVMDDNIRLFYRRNKNRHIEALTGAPFLAMEDFCERYTNVLLAGPSYEMFVMRRYPHPPFVANTRIYSCLLIRNDAPFRWIGRYNEDTILSIRVLKARYCTIQFNAFMQKKMATQLVAGGNTAEFYEKEGTGPKTEMLVRLHGDIARPTIKYGRKHHFVDYSSFKSTKLILRPDFKMPTGNNEYGMELSKRA